MHHAQTPLATRLHLLAAAYPCTCCCSTPRHRCSAQQQWQGRKTSTAPQSRCAGVSAAATCHAQSSLRLQLACCRCCKQKATGRYRRRPKATNENASSLINWLAVCSLGISRVAAACCACTTLLQCSSCPLHCAAAAVRAFSPFCCARAAVISLRPHSVAASRIQVDDPTTAALEISFLLILPALLITEGHLALVLDYSQ